MTPYQITLPTALPVTLDAIKRHLRIDLLDVDFDDQLGELMASAVAYLDGPRGVLGRCIMAQTWAVDVTCEGTYTLPMPDVTGATVDYGAGAEMLEVGRSAGGPTVTVTGAGTVIFTCEMPAINRPAVERAVKFLVERDFDRPEGSAAVALEAALQSSIAAMRWRRI